VPVADGSLGTAERIDKVYRVQHQIKGHSHVRSSEYEDCVIVGDPKAGETSRRPVGLDQTEGSEKPSSWVLDKCA